MDPTGSERPEPALSDDDWRRLAELREVFLASEERGTSGGDYWLDARELELYDATFGQRIAWKWHAALDELAHIAFAPPEGPVLDWGCGTGIAARAYFERFPPAAGQVLHLWDRSALALAHAERVLRARWPALAVQASPPPFELAPAVLLASHVLSELDDLGLSELLALARRSSSLLWVEPGSRATSLRLSQAREELLAEFDVLAPCTHQAACGALALGRERDWCHHHARPPGEAHRSRHWRRFAEELGIDLRGLSYAWLAFKRRSTPSAVQGSGLMRILGRPRMEKGRALLLVCRAAGLADLILLQRTDKALFRRLRDCAGERLVYRVQTEGQRIRSIELPGNPPETAARS